MPTVNEKVQDASIRHQVYLGRYATGLLRRLIRLLNAAEDDVARQIRDRLEAIEERGFDLGPATTARLRELERAIEELLGAAYSEMEARSLRELRDLADLEAEHAAGTLNAALPDDVPTRYQAVLPPAEALAAIVSRDPLRGKPLRSWWREADEAQRRRVIEAVRIGMIENDSLDAMIRRIRGTRAQNYRNGVAEIGRRSAELVVRTAVNHISNRARARTYERNADILKGERWTSTIDGRTSAICRARDGKIYPVGGAPFPPAHPRCRSVRVPVTKSWRELGLDIDEISAGSRASMDGQVPGGETYNSWLRKQPRGFVVDVLGEAKAKLYLDGGLSLDRFVDERAGEELTLDELRRREPEAFRRAGL